MFKNFLRVVQQSLSNPPIGVKDFEKEKGRKHLGRNAVENIISIAVGVTWKELKERLNDDGFNVDHYHGTLSDFPEEVIHIDADSGEMNSTLMFDHPLLPADFQTLRADL